MLLISEEAKFEVRFSKTIREQFNYVLNTAKIIILQNYKETKYQVSVKHINSAIQDRWHETKICCVTNSRFS